MTEPIITEDELKDFNEGYNATLKLVNKHPELPSELLRNNSALIEVINIYHLKNNRKSIHLPKFFEICKLLNLSREEIADRIKEVRSKYRTGGIGIPAQTPDFTDRLVGLFQQHHRPLQPHVEQVIAGGDSHRGLKTACQRGPVHLEMSSQRLDPECWRAPFLFDQHHHFANQRIVWQALRTARHMRQKIVRHHASFDFIFLGAHPDRIANLI